MDCLEPVTGCQQVTLRDLSSAGLARVALAGLCQLTNPCLCVCEMSCCHRGHRGKCHPGSNQLAQQQSGDTTRDVPVGRKVLALASLLCWLRAVTHEPQSGLSLPGVFLSWIPANSLQQLIQQGWGSARSHSCHPGPVIPPRVGRSTGKRAPVPTRPRRARSEPSVILLQWERLRLDGFAGCCS